MTLMRTVELNFLSVNCYLLYDDKTRKAIIVDPGSSEDLIFEAVSDEKIIPQGVILTHAHVDHISAVPEVAAKYNIPVWIHPDDVPIYFSPDNALRPWMDTAKGLPQPVKDCPMAGLDFQVIHTPGHTPGGICLYFPGEKFVITGDTLFRGTYGRTDFAGGDERAIFRSIREKLLTLPEDVIVYPGHGPSTTIKTERNNPLFQ